MRLSFASVPTAVLAAILLVCATGCLHLGLGTRETHVHDNPGTEARIKGLEARVSNLEQYFQDGTSAPVSEVAIP